MLDLAARDQRVRDRLDRRGRDREADADVGARVAGDLGVDADDLTARIEQRAARVAVVDRGVGLDRVVDRELVRSRHLAVQSADDPARHGFLEAERASDRNHGVTDLELVRIAELHRMKQRRRRVDLDHGQVRRRVGADDRGLVRVPVPEPDRDTVRLVDDVLVRDDVPVAVDHEAGALCLGLLVPHRGRLIRGDGDLDDASVGVPVDLADRQTGAVGRGLGALDAHRLHDGLRRGRMRNGVGDCARTRAEGESADQHHCDNWESGASIHFDPFGKVACPNESSTTPYPA